jgi:hypothetical protein
MTTLKFDEYIALCKDPKTGEIHVFKVSAVSPTHAELQARDGYFGLLAPPSEERRAELKVTIEKC